jgi:hypothetical protein
MASATSTPLSASAQEAFVMYYNNIQINLNNTRDTIRDRFTEIDKVYQREKDLTTENARAKQANKNGDADRFKNITVPVVMPQVEAAVTYQTSVFLTGSPLFGVVAAPEFINEALQLETVIDDEAVMGGWTRDFILSFRDGFKYNFAPMEVAWKKEVTVNLETDLDYDPKLAKPTQTIWEGNKIKRLDPYNTFVDQSVPPTEVYSRGEYAGYTEFMSKIELKAFIESLPDKIIANIVPAFESDCKSSVSTDSGSKYYYVPDINPDVDTDRDGKVGTNWSKWFGFPQESRHIQYKDAYEVTTLYCRILPSEFALKVPNRNTPQIYKLIFVNHEHILYAERQTNAHNFLPILIGQPLEDGLGYQTKSLADNAEPFQTVASAFMNSIMHGRRRAVTDRVLYDPSRIASAHINSDNPSAKVPVRPAAYGKNVADAVYQFPYRDDQAQNSMQQIQVLMGMANGMAGQNQASQGQFVKGNKTLHEFESVMQNANGRDQLVSILLESQMFTPIKTILKTNILQFQGGTTIYNRDKNVAVEVDPIKLRRAVLSFKISDGLIPSSKLINADSWASALQVIGSSPQISAGYNIAPMFSYLMKVQGAKIGDFEKSPEQQAYEQALNSWQQVAMVAAEKGIDPEKIAPMPVPEQYGYNPTPQAPKEVQ